MSQRLHFERTRRLFLFAAAAGAGGVALSACGGAQGQTGDAPSSDAGPAPVPPPAPSPPPPPAPAPAPGGGGASGGTYTYQIGATENSAFPPGTTTKITTGATGMVVQVSPDLPPGRTLSLASNGDVNVVAEAGAPQADLRRPWVIEVMDSPVSPMIRRVTAGRSKDYSRDAYPSGRWNTIMAEAQAGDEFEIAPGAIHAQLSDLNNYHSNNLNSALLSIIKPGITLRHMAGRGRWGLYPDRSQVAGGRNGICIYSPGSSGDMKGRGSFWIEGFEFDNWGNDAGVRIMPAAAVNGTYTNMHSALTLKNFKIGRRSGETSASGISGAVETLLVEDGHVYDCGNGSGQEHNVYVSARTMTWRGVRQSRTRGWSSTPYAAFAGIEGHVFKVSAVTGTIEGCVVDCASLADHSLILQMKAGGNWTVRGNLFIDSQAPNNANGAIVMEREYAADGVTQNFEWWAGVEGNSILFEKNVWIGHYPRPIFFFRDPAVHPNQALYASSDSSVSASRRLSSFVCRDNIAMVATSQPYGNWMLSGFPGTNNSMWLRRDPNGGTHWTGRGNTVMTYGTDEPGFTADEKALKLYRRSAGPVAANAGTVATQRFVYPHGYEPRNDAYGGLG